MTTPPLSSPCLNHICIPLMCLNLCVSPLKTAVIKKVEKRYRQSKSKEKLVLIDFKGAV